MYFAVIMRVLIFKHVVICAVNVKSIVYVT